MASAQWTTTVWLVCFEAFIWADFWKTAAEDDVVDRVLDRRGLPVGSGANQSALLHAWKVRLVRR